MIQMPKTLRECYNMLVEDTKRVIQVSKAVKIGRQQRDWTDAELWKVPFIGEIKTDKDMMALTNAVVEKFQRVKNRGSYSFNITKVHPLTDGFVYFEHTVSIPD